jgi:hypothetical protein
MIDYTRKNISIIAQQAFRFYAASLKMYIEL